MKLLTKREVADRKNEETRKEAEQGSFLAAKIDQLRKTSVEEENKLSASRKLMLEVIKEDITELETKKTLLISEIDSLKNQRVELLKPLDKEWANVNSEKSVLKIEWNKIEESRSENHKLANQLQDQIDMADNYLIQAEEYKEKTRKLSNNRELQMAQVARLTEKLKSDIENFVTISNKKEELLNNKELRIEIREKELDIKLQNLKKRESELKEQYVRNRRQQQGGRTDSSN